MDNNKILDSGFQEPRVLKPQPINILRLILSLVGIGVLIGASTNLINGIVSQEYFHQIMGWDYLGIEIRAIIQGVIEGVMYGTFLGIVYTAGFTIITKAKADLKFIKGQLKKIIFIIYSWWIIGGSVAIILAFAFPQDYDNIIYAVPQETFPRLGYAWVGGSILGGISGGIAAVIYGLIDTYKLWKIELTNNLQF